MNYIRRKRAQSSYNPYTHHVIYSPDADLIILGLATHEHHVTIMRDEFNPYKPPFCDICQQPGHEFKECQGIPMEKLDQSRSLASNTVDPIKTNYIFVDLSILRYKLFEFLTNNNQSSFQWEFERFLDDWVFICLLIGNDFLPDLPSFEIYENSIDDLLTIYLQHVPEFNDYLTKSGQLEIELFKRILKAFSKNEGENFQKWHQKRQQWQNNNQPPKIQTKPPLNLNEYVMISSVIY
jgi:5'-3' exoribonuclease 2